MAGLDAFLEDVLKKNKWDPNRGASLKTFFIGQCKFQFRNVYKAWYRAEHRLRRFQLTDDHVKLQAALGSTCAADAPLMHHESAMRALGGLSTKHARHAVTLHAMGYSYAEIAREIGVADEKAVENLVGHQRRRMNKSTAPEERAV